MEGSDMSGVREQITPLVNNNFLIPGTGRTFNAACFAGTHWSLGPLQKPEDVAQNLSLALQVNDALRGLGVRRAYAPNPVPSNGKIVKPGQLQRILPLGDVFLCRNQAWPGDGSFLSMAGDAGVFSAGGCGVIVLAYGGRMVFAHASRESLLDRQWVKTQGLERSRDLDVIDNALNALEVPKGLMDKVHAWLLYFIHPDSFAHHFDDEKHAEWNQAAGKFLPKEFDGGAWVKDNAVTINLPTIAAIQLTRRGVPLDNIDTDHCYLSKELPTTRKEGGRYLVAIVRN